MYDTNEKLTKEDKFTFEIHLDGSSQIINLKINDWDVIKNYIIIK